MDVSAIISALDDHGFEDTLTTRKLEVLNDTYWDFCSRMSWPFLVKSATLTTTSGTRTPNSLPADFNKAISLRVVETDIKLMPERLENIYVQDPNANDTGDPENYYFVGNALRIYPTPDGTYTVTMHYYSWPPALLSTDLEATLLIPSRHHRVLVLGCLYKLYNMEDDTDIAKEFERMYEERITRLIDDLMSEQYDRPDYIVDVDPTDYSSGWSL